MEIRITDDFDLKKIAASGQCFRVRESGDGMFRFVTGNHLLSIRKKAVSAESPSAGKLTPGEESTCEKMDGDVCEALRDDVYEVSCDEKTWDAVWRPYFDLDRNYASIRRSIPEDDLFLRRAAETGRGIRILRQDPWEMLITFIISQRKNIPAIRRAVETIAEQWGSVLTESEDAHPGSSALPGSGAIHAFPAQAQLCGITAEELESCHLGYRTPYVLDAIRKVTDTVDLKALSSCSDAELLSKLEEIRGVGIKVANCVGLFAYGRTSLAPVDVWIKRIVDEEYGGRDPFPGYGENSGIMQQYMFYFAQTEMKSSR